jgi:hypothetical protein
MNQLDRILELTGRPGGGDLDAIGSPFAATMMESCSVTAAKRLAGESFGFLRVVRVEEFFGGGVGVRACVRACVYSIITT